MNIDSLWDWDYGFSSWFEKTRESNHLQMLFSTQLDPAVLVRPEFWSRNLRNKSPLLYQTSQPVDDLTARARSRSTTGKKIHI